MARDLVCAECGGTMQGGIMVESSRIGEDATYWLEGKPERGFWSHLLKTKGKKAFYVAAYRCEKCGFLKFYAGPDHSDN